MGIFAEDLTAQMLGDLVQVARGQKKATLLIRNCRLVNVYSGEIYETDIVVYKDRIASVTAGAVQEAEEVVDAAGMYAIPGLIDPHMHVDTTMLWPNELARVLVARGTTTVVVDMVNVAHNGGKEAVRAMMEGFEGQPLRALFSAPSYCPMDPEIETAAAEIDSRDIAQMLRWDERVVSIGETVSARILNREPDYLLRLAACHAQGKLINGHGGDLPRGDEAALDAYVASGVRDDHCVARPEQILPRLRRGLSMFLVEAPGRQQTEAFFRYIRENRIPTGEMSLCIDNITIGDIVGSFGGYLDTPLRLGLRSGLPAVDVIRMATLNPARHYHLEGQLGSLTPGRLADILLLRELSSFPPALVVAGGRIAARDRETVGTWPEPVIAPAYLKSIRLPENLSPDSFRVPAGNREKGKVHVISIHDGDAFNDRFTAILPVREGDVAADPAQDVLKIAILERYGRGGGMTTAFAQGFGLKRGAIATSYSVPSNNIVVVGTNNEDMAFAVRCLEENQGGFVAVEGGKVLAQVHLPIGGIMTADPYETLLADIRKANQAVRGLGCQLKHPYFSMSQTVLSSLPELGLTDKGLIEVPTGKIISVLAED